jgi:hypothetical protein
MGVGAVGAEMTGYGRWVYAINLPITLYLVLWIWLGRVPFGLTSWWVAIFPLTLGLIMALCLRATIGIARSPRHPRWFHRDEANAHVVMWLTMGVFGLALVDEGESVLSRLAGPEAHWVSWSWVLMALSAVIGVAAWAAVLLTTSSVVDRTDDSSASTK